MGIVTNWIRKTAEYWHGRKTDWRLVRSAQQEGEAGAEARRLLAAWFTGYLHWAAARATTLRDRVCEAAQAVVLDLLRGRLLRGRDPRFGRLHTYLSICVRNRVRRGFEKQQVSLDWLLDEEEMDFPAREEIREDDPRALSIDDLIAEVLKATRRALKPYPRAWEALQRWVLARGEGPRPPMCEVARKMGLTTRRFESLIEVGNKALRAEIHRVCARFYDPDDPR